MTKHMKRCSTLLITAAATAAKSLQSCPTLCDPRDGSPPGSPVPGILQARTLEWVGISFSSVWKWKVTEKSLSHVRLFATPWTAAYQAPPSMGFSRQEYWSGVPVLITREMQIKTAMRYHVTPLRMAIIKKKKLQTINAGDGIEKREPTLLHFCWNVNWYINYWEQYAAAAAKSVQSCPTLCDPRDSSPPGSPVPGILQARTLEWVAISFSNACKWEVKAKLLSRVRLSTTPGTAA